MRVATSLFVCEKKREERKTWKQNKVNIFCCAKYMLIEKLSSSQTSERKKKSIKIWSPKIEQRQLIWWKSQQQQQQQQKLSRIKVNS